MPRYLYPTGTVRWFRWHGANDVRGHRPPPGWIATAYLIDHHPITQWPLGCSQWWMQETLTPAESAR